MLRIFLSALAQYGLAELLLINGNARQYVGKLIRSAVLFLIAALVAGFSVVFVLLALFFQLADLTTLVQPALITAGVGLLVVLLLVFEGWRRMAR